MAKIVSSTVVQVTASQILSGLVQKYEVKEQKLREARDGTHQA